MIKLLVFCLCIYGVVSSPFQKYEMFDDVDNDAEVVEAMELLKGTGNLQEKRVPVIRLAMPDRHIGPYGNRNLGEHIQVPYDSVPSYLPGLQNLNEKAIPEQAIYRNSGRHPKSEVVAV